MSYDRGQHLEPDDKHKIAYRVLTEPRGVEMGERLGIKPAESRACISCHGIPPRRVSGWIIRSEPISDGVSCVACHGAYQDWVLKHHTPPNNEDWQKFRDNRMEKSAGSG